MKLKLKVSPFADWNLDKKLVFVYAIMIILPIIIVTLLGFQRYQENLTERVSEFGLNLTDQIGKNLDNYIRQIDRLSMTFYLDGVDGLRGQSDPMNVYSEKIAVDRALRNMMLIIPFQDIEGIYWIRNGEVQYSQYGSGKWIDHGDFMEQGWYDRVLAADGSGVILPPYKPEFAHGISSSNAGSDRYIFSYARSIVNVSNRVPYGVLLIDLSTDNLFELLHDVKIQTASTLFIVDDEGRIIYHPDTERIGSEFISSLPGDYGKFTFDPKGGDEPLMVQYVRSAVTGWTVVNTIPKVQLSDELSILRNLLWTFTVVVLILAILLSSVFTTTIIRPLKRMKRMMRRVEIGDYAVRYDNAAKDEIGQLGNSFNHMVEKINELVNHVLTLKIDQQQAEFEALRSQINPHFLYNTLESINMKAEINKDYEVAEMVSLLGKLFRLSLQQSTGFITLSRELEYVEVYMKLQRIRFPKMTYSIEVDDELLHARTFPWIIQPIVENAIVHGIAPKKGHGSIRIRGEQREDMLVVTVEDDGCGISESRLLEIEESLQRSHSDAEGRHIGLSNVHKRIRSIDGKDLGLTLLRLPEGGTSVLIRMRLRSEEGSVDAENDDRR